MPALHLSVEEQGWLLDALAQLLTTCGWNPFLEAPLLEPTDHYFPDLFSPDMRGARTLTRRLMLYAGLGDLRVRLLSFEDSPRSIQVDEGGLPGHRQHVDTAGCFLGIEAGACLFGVNVNNLRDSGALTATMSHEVAHAWRCHHGIVNEDPSVEELLTDVTTIYLGFGVLTVNASYRYKSSRYLGGSDLQYSHSTLGYLQPEAMCFLLAAQAVARRHGRGDVARIRKMLEPNQSVFFAAARKQLAKEARFRHRLGLEGVGASGGDLLRRQWVVPALPADVAEDELESCASTPRDPRRANAGQPIFRVRRTKAEPYALLGLLVGGVLGVAVGATTQWLATPLVIMVACVVGLMHGRNIPWDYCSDSNCRADLATSDDVCPRCGGLIRGTIRNISEQLLAYEELERQSRAAKRSARHSSAR